jgi:hypothetical protein
VCNLGITQIYAKIFKKNEIIFVDSKHQTIMSNCSQMIKLCTNYVQHHGVVHALALQEHVVPHRPRGS